jgi:hypothetical protein
MLYFEQRNLHMTYIVLLKLNKKLTHILISSLKKRNLYDLCLKKTKL